MTLRLRIVLYVYRALGWLKRYGALLGGLVLALLTLGAYRRQVERAKKSERLSREDTEAARALSQVSRDSLRARANRLAEEAARGEAKAAQHDQEILELRKAVSSMDDSEIVKEFQRRAAEWRTRGPKLLPVVLLLALSSQAHAQSEPVQAPHPTTQEQGLWLPFDYARELLADAQELELERAHLRELQRILQIRAEESAELRRSLDVAEESIGELAAHDAASSLRAREAEADAALQRRRRWIWFGVGLGLGVVGSVTLAVSL